VRGTPLLTLFYTLMGARVHRTAKLNAFVREFDLVRIGPHATHAGSIQARIFTSQRTLRFRPVVLEEGSLLDGIARPGVRLGKRSSVAKLSVVSEGVQVAGRFSCCSFPRNPSSSIAHALLGRSRKTWRARASRPGLEALPPRRPPTTAGGKKARSSWAGWARCCTWASPAT
jgi:hypothetical protein